MLEMLVDAIKKERIPVERVENCSRVVQVFCKRSNNANKVKHIASLMDAFQEVDVIFIKSENVYVVEAWRR